ncbi:phospholipase D family protein [Alisedimentitalea sp. MJ-SS2]|uniref:phospholipase D family protein n=1 Tax=Aliisedimentitalea sp. MJ-SS2 TaxID=3049795 RepID=UPI00290839CB|nr:phospholipase D family protein [Alisedimentitalea sp. MJ-SS2]MDU8928896.1 phospholipase D family protein [Alisedimentitalea sp. MJ-SS2]
MTFLGSLVLIVLAAIAAVALLRLVFPLPGISRRAPSYALPADKTGPLSCFLTEEIDNNPGKTGVVTLNEASSALAQRLALVHAAQSAIDAQYYIWHDDTSGILLLDALLAAARRGVQVRLLLDDNGITGLDPIVATLNAQPNFEIRLFNPSTVRRPKTLGYAFSFVRMNRRMHNKSFIVDGTAAIIGGRNIGDEYFAIGEGQFFLDLDVLAVGPVVARATRVFDDYWNCASAFEAETIISGSGDLTAFQARADRVKNSPEAQSFLTEAATAEDLHIANKEQVEWTDVALVADDPAKGEGEVSRDKLLISHFADILGGVSTRLDVISAYFVPGVRGARFFTDLAKRGVKVNVLTNALVTTDVLLVHSGYTRYRRRLLKAGVSLFELKPRPGMATGPDAQLKPLGLAGASLHAKTFAVDGRRVFIGSLNLDPRSAILNCEMGLIIDSPTMAGRMQSHFDGPVDAVSYKPQLTPEKRMVWSEAREDGSTRIYQEEPGASLGQQVALTLIGLLPVEWLL